MATQDMARSATPPDDLKHVLDTARDALDHEFQRAERFDAKARGQATLAGSWFTVAQAVTALSLRSGHVPHGILIVVLAALGLGAVCLFLLLRASSQVWRLKTRNDVTPATLEAMADAAKNGDPDFALNAIYTYRNILSGAQQANAERARALDPESNRWRSAPGFWWGVLGFGLVEIAAALLSRVVG
jgi:hypothetical protein